MASYPDGQKATQQVALVVCPRGKLRMRPGYFVIGSVREVRLMWKDATCPLQAAKEGDEESGT